MPRWLIFSSPANTVLCTLWFCWLRAMNSPARRDAGRPRAPGPAGSGDQEPGDRFSRPRTAAARMPVLSMSGGWTFPFTEIWSTGQLFAVTVVSGSNPMTVNDSR